jgi:histidine ammonia-lyase
LTDEKEILQRVLKSHDYIEKAVSAGKPIYGVTTGFGAMAHTNISPDDAGELQENLIKTSTVRDSVLPTLRGNP